MSKDYVTRTFTSVKATATVMNKATKTLETITAMLPQLKDEAQIEKKMKKYCEARNLIFCTLDDWSTENSRRRMTVEKFLADSEEF